MLVLLHALVIERGDELLDLFDKLLRLTDGRARRRVEEQRRRTTRQRDELAFLGRRLSVILLDAPRPASCRSGRSVSAEPWEPTHGRRRHHRGMPAARRDDPYGDGDDGRADAAKTPRHISTTPTIPRR